MTSRFRFSIGGRLAAVMAGALCAFWFSASPAALGASLASATAEDSTLTVTPAGWPNITGLAVLADGLPVNAVNGAWTVGKHARLTVLAAGIELGNLPAKPTLTLFDLVPGHECGSSASLGKVLSLLFALDTDQDPSNGISLPANLVAPAAPRLADLTESDLLALEQQLTGRSVALNTALLAANAALDQETWTEQVGSRTPLVNDMSVLQAWLDRVFGALALDANALDGFAALAPSEVAKVSATLKGQGMSYDGNIPVFSWRYGLHRADPNTFEPTLAYPFDFPQDIQALFATFGGRPDYGHIGDIDIANGKLYAPIEDEDNSQLQSFIAVFDAKTLQYTGEKHPLPLELHTDGVPWVAVDARHNELYTVTWSGAPAGSLNVFDLNSFALKRIVPLQRSFDGRRVQGAKVFDGFLYAASDAHDAGALPNTKRKYLFKVDTVSGAVSTLYSYDAPNHSEGEGLGFSPDGTLHLIVLDPYTSPYASGTNNPKVFGDSYSIDGDDWNPSGSIRHLRRDAPPLRDQLCRK